MKKFKFNAGISGIILLVVAIIIWFTATCIQRGFMTVLGWFTNSQAILAYIIIGLALLIIIPISISIKINKK